MSEIEVRPFAKRATLSVRVKTSPAELGAVLASVFPRIFAYAAAAGAGPGLPYVRYWARSAGTLDIEAGLPVQKALEAKGDIVPGEIGGGSVAAVEHLGPYEGLPAVHEKLAAWLKTAKRRPEGPSLEIYLTDPGDEPRPERWRTQVLQPLV